MTTVEIGGRGYAGSIVGCYIRAPRSAISLSSALRPRNYCPTPFLRLSALPSFRPQLTLQEPLLSQRSSPP